MANVRKILVLGAVAVAAAGFAAAAYAQAQQPQTPKTWSYSLDKNGQRVPKSEPGDQSGRQLARGSPPGQLRDRQGTVGERRVSRNSRVQPAEPGLGSISGT